ncbi:MAG: class I SAM-dependent methyltransferase [Chloroflexi bacterium]|nr:class I SAM-dependent methyltransferase [Chloroflexota bacterium]
MAEQRDMQSQGDSDKQAQYTHGHSEDITRYMGRRNASTNAAFLIPYLEVGMSLLDCGCGPGTITLGLAETVSPGEVAGIDFAENQIERARASAAEKGISNTRFEVGNVYELPFADNSFDVVFCHTLLEHLKEPHRALSEMYRVLKPGGVIGVSEGDRGNNVFWPDDHPLLKYFDLLIELVRHNGGDPFVGRKLKSLLSQAGFASLRASASCESYEPIQVYMDTGRSYILSTFGPQVMELGWATQSEVEALAAACDDLANNPAAYIATVKCNVVGWK